MVPVLPYHPVYRTAKGYRILLFLLLPPLLGVALAMPFLAQHDSAGQPMSTGGRLFFAVMGLGFAAFCVYGLLDLVKGHLTLTPEGLRQVGVFKTTELPYEQVSGFQRVDKYTFVRPRAPGQPSIKIASTTERYEELNFWLAAHFPNLDTVEAQAQLEQALAREDLGRTPEERTDRLAEARRAAWVLNIAGGLVAAWLLLHPRPYQWAVAAGLLVPLLAAGALWWHQGTLQLAESKNSPYPTVLLAVGAPAFMLTLRTLFDVEFVDYAQVWPLVAQVGVGYGLLLALGARSWLFGRDTALATGVTLLVLAFLYGYGASTMFDTAFDEAPPQRYAARVLDKHLSRGKTTTYYLHLTPWGPIRTAEDVTVDAALYDYVQPGSPVHVQLYPGRLGAAWFTTTQ